MRPGLRLTAFTTVTAVALATLLAAPAAAADPPTVTAVTIVSATIDLDTHLPMITFRIACSADIPMSQVRLGMILTQHDAMPAGKPSDPDPHPVHLHAFSWQKNVFPSCVAGGTADTTITFGRQQGEFTPGRATLDGWVQANWPYTGGADFRELAVNLRPS